MIGEKIKVEMIKHNMKNVDLARLIGVKASTITHYINGDVNPKPVKLLVYWGYQQIIYME
jgi:transcriptional regulator with XRE-family HTH domain